MEWSGARVSQCRMKPTALIVAAGLLLAAVASAGAAYGINEYREMPSEIGYDFIILFTRLIHPCAQAGASRSEFSRYRLQLI